VLSLPEKVTVVEVGPRDGLQSLDRWIETDLKVAMIDRLTDAGFPVIEVSSFVHPKVVPNLVDAREVISRIKRRPGTVYRALVPNKRGTLNAVETDIDEILGLMTVSEAYLRKNQNMTLDEVIEVAGDCFEVADGAGRDFIMAMGVSMFCPYEGVIDPEKTLDCVSRLRDRGIRRFYLAASTGMESPVYVHDIFTRAFDRFSDCEFGFHVHEKIGLAPASVLAALQAGVTMVEGSICGIGGGMVFPGGTGSVGNLASEDIINYLNTMGIETGITSDAALRAARDIGTLLDIPVTSRLGAVGTREDYLRHGA